MAVVIWKLLVGAEVGLEDLKVIDPVVGAMLQRCRDEPDAGTTFSITSISGEVVVCCAREGGPRTRPTWHDSTASVALHCFLLCCAVLCCAVLCCAVL